MGEAIRQGSEKLTGGEVNALPPHLVGLDEAADTLNLDPRDLRGATTRNGRSQFGINNGSAVGVKGLKAWTRDSGTFFLVARLATTFYDVSAAAWSSIGIGGTSGERFRAAALNNVLAIAVDGIAPRKWDGTTFGALGGSPPAESKFAVVYASKLWLAGDDANPQTKTGSATNNPEDFTAANDALSITTQDGGGDTIQGLITNRQVLITLYRHYADVLIGDSIANFREERLTERGLVSSTGYVAAGEVAFWASDDAVWMAAGTRVSDITTLKMRQKYKDIADKSKITLGVSNDLLLVVDYGADKAYTYGWKTGTWSTWNGQEWEVLESANDGTLYAGTDGGSTTQVWKLDTGSLDGTASITARWRTPNLGYGWPDAIKNMIAFRLHAKPGLPTTTVTFYKDGVSTANTKTLTFAATGDHAWEGGYGQSKLRGRYLGMQLEWVGAGTLYGWVMYAEVTTDRGQLPVEA